MRRLTKGIVGALASALLMAGAAAGAQMTAVYTVPDRPPLRIEIGQDGAARIGLEGAAIHALYTAAGEFLVWTEEDGPRVARLSDFSAVQRQMLSGLGGNAGSQTEEAAPGGGAGNGMLAPRGTAEVAGRTGQLYVRAASGMPVLVLSGDPDLRPLGAAWSRALPTAADLHEALGADVDLLEEFAALARTGAPLRIAGITLSAVEEGSIPPVRFALPAAPMSREEVEAMLMRDDDLGH